MDSIRLIIISLISSIKKYFSNTQGEEKDRVIGSLYAIFTVFTVAFFGFMALNPTIATISSLQKQLKDSQDLNKALEDKINAIIELDNEYKKQQEDLSNVLKAIPIAPEIPFITKKVEKLASQSNVSLSRLSIGSIELYPANKKSPSLYSFTITFSIGGNNNNINTFINRAVTFDRLISIDSISKDNKKDESASASIVARAYFNR